MVKDTLQYCKLKMKTDTERKLTVHQLSGSENQCNTEMSCYSQRSQNLKESYTYTHCRYKNVRFKIFGEIIWQVLLRLNIIYPFCADFPAAYRIYMTEIKAILNKVICTWILFYYSSWWHFYSGKLNNNIICTLKNKIQPLTK